MVAWPEASVTACAGNELRFVLDGQTVASLNSRLTQDSQTLALTLPADGKQHWLRPDVTTAEGKLILLGNPIYLNHVKDR